VTMPERRRWWIWVALGLILVGLLVVLIKWGQPLYGFVADEKQIHTWILGFGGWGPLAIVVLEMAQIVLAPLPGQAIGAVSGFLYGPWWGTLYALAGMAIGSLLTFLLARRFGRPLVLRLVGEQSMERLDELVRRGGALFFFLIWLLPFAPDDLACMAAGLTPMPIRQYLVLMLVGRLPGLFISVWLGANAARISPAVWISLIAVLAVAALMLWRWGGKIEEAVLHWIGRFGGRPGK
jgi:uncharacterized membrane protein YdjX (TVP38/TMEM64 family)